MSTTTIYEMCARCRNRIESFDNGQNWWHEHEPTDPDCWVLGPLLREGPREITHWDFTHNGEGRVVATIGIGFDNTLTFSFPPHVALHMLGDAMSAANEAEQWREWERENHGRYCANCDSCLDGMDSIRVVDERTGETV